MSCSESLDISGLNKLELLEALVNGSKPAAFFTHSGMTPPAITKGELQEHLVAKDGYVEYACGRVIRCDLSGETMQTWGYDRDNGQGAARRVVDQLRAKTIKPKWWRWLHKVVA